MLWTRFPSIPPMKVEPIPIDDKVRRLYGTLVGIAGAVAIFWPLSRFAWWLGASNAQVFQSLNLGSDWNNEFGLFSRTSLATMNLMLDLPASWAFWRLRDCLFAFEAGLPLSPRGLGGLRDFSLGVALGVLARSVSPVFHSLLLTSLFGSSPVALKLTWSSETIMLIAFAGTIAAICWSLERAAVLTFQAHRRN